MAKLIWLLLLSLSLSLAAQQAETTTQDLHGSLDEDLHDGFELLQDLPTKNQIPLFENRFRIDDNVAEITLLMFRRRGSASVVLVRPDGSKLHFNTAEQNDIRWHDASSYDLIQIKNPMPGPWQAVGKLLPQSRVMVLTDIQLHVDALPSDLMVGETVKVTARLTNGDQPINVREFREVLALEVIFVSTNNAEYDNFGRGVVQVATFRDDGKGYDERSRDGVFTGEFQLRFVAGEWTPKYIVRTPLYTREVEQPPVVLLAAPIVADITASPVYEAVNPDEKVELQPHNVLFRVTDKKVNAASVLLQGRIRYPNGDVDEFALNEPGLTPRQLELHNRGHGSYILEVQAFGAMQNGREFMLNLPEISFVVNRQVYEAPVLAELPQHIKDEIAAENAPPEPEFPWLLVIVANIFILGGGGFAIWFVINDKKLADLMFWRKKPAEAQNSASPSTAKATATEKMPANAQKNNDMDDILDLTLPDD
ncbi:TIGR03503 family protein [Rheinheimera gaetbuli]